MSSIRLVVLIALLAVPFATFVQFFSRNIGNDPGTQYGMRPANVLLHARHCHNLF